MTDTEKNEALWTEFERTHPELTASLTDKKGNFDRITFRRMATPKFNEWKAGANGIEYLNGLGQATNEKGETVSKTTQLENAIEQANRKENADSAYDSPKNENTDEAQKNADTALETKSDDWKKEQLNKMSFAEYATDNTFYNNFSTADQLVQKAKDEGLTKQQVIDALKNTKWSEDKNGNIAKAFEKYYPEIKEAPKQAVETTSINSKEETTNSETSAVPETETKDKTTSSNIDENGKFEENKKGLWNWIKTHKGGLRLLGEIIAATAANAINGANAGFRGTQFTPTAYKTLERAWERNEKIKDTEAEGEADIRKQRNTFSSAIKSSPNLNKYDNETKNKLVDLLLSGNTNRSDFEKIIGKSGSEADEDYQSFKALGNLNSIVENKKGVVELNGKELDLRKNQAEIISSLETQKTELQKQKIDVASLPYDKYVELVQNYKNIYSGIQAASKSIGQTTGTSFGVSANVRGGIPVVSGGISGNASTTNGTSESNSLTTDQLALVGVAEGKNMAAEYAKNAKGVIEAFNASIDEAIKEIDEQIKAVKEYSVNDGIIKGKGIAQKIVRADGTEINLNPNDNIYATTNEITNGKDNGSDVIPLEADDKAIVIQKKLGYCGDAINKNFDYYLNRLRG